MEVLGGSGEGLNFGLIVRRFFLQKQQTRKKSKHRILLPCAVFREGHRFGKSARSSTNMQVFFILFSSKIGPKSKKLARKTVIEVKVGRKSFRGPSLNVHFQVRERF